MLSSPRPWGCFRSLFLLAARLSVFPTPVGVFPIYYFLSILQFGLPHARGGVSQVHCITLKTAQSSPRPWGCFPLLPVIFKVSVVFPTPVGVFPREDCLLSLSAALPHARGGVSFSSLSTPNLSTSSPRPGGVSKPPEFSARLTRVFPTPGGCFHQTKRLPSGTGVSSPRSWGAVSQAPFRHL